MTGNATLDYIINGILAILLGVVGFFLKRTMTDVDQVRGDVDKGKGTYATQETVAALRQEVECVKLEYTPRKDFEKLEGKIDKVTENLHEVQMNSISKEDFFVKMSEIAGSLERMEDKMERYRNGG